MHIIHFEIYPKKRTTGWRMKVEYSKDSKRFNHDIPLTPDIARPLFRYLNHFVSRIFEK